VYPDAKFRLLEEASGYVGTNAYGLPAETGSTQLVIAMSLFTHLDPQASLRYFEEAQRVLSDDGAGLLTFRLLDEESAPQADAAAERARLPMTKTPDAWWYGKEGYLDIFYTRAAVARMAEQARLEVIAIRKGHWSLQGGDSANPAAHQDMVMVRRAR